MASTAIEILHHRYPWPAEKPDVPPKEFGWFHGQNRRVLSSYPVLFHQQRDQRFLGDRSKRHMLASGNDGRQQVRASRGGQDQQCLGRRFFEGFQQRVSCLRGHGMRL